jgi:hypothetical protein
MDKGTLGDMAGVALCLVPIALVLWALIDWWRGVG